VATNVNSEKATRRIEANFAGILGTGTKEDESSTKRVWAAEFQHFTAHSSLARILKLMSRLFVDFSNLFSGRGKPRITESANTGARHV
jgi:hypothetical protein